MRRPIGAGLTAIIILAASACVAEEESPSPSSAPSLGASATALPSATQSVGGLPSATGAASPTPTAEPALSLDPPEQTDARVVTVTVAPEVGETDGTLTVTVSSTSDQRIDELVLRWPAELNDTLFIAPFTPSPERIADGGPPLVQPWTKWVIGPGEKGEPDGTISVGWGPLLPGATLTIELDVTRRAPNPVAFDLQLLAGNDLLTFDDGAPAELRVEVP